MFIKKIFLFACKHPRARLVVCASMLHPGKQNRGALPPPTAHPHPPEGLTQHRGCGAAASEPPPSSCLRRVALKMVPHRWGSLEVQRPRQPERASGSAAF